MLRERYQRKWKSYKEGEDGVSGGDEGSREGAEGEQRVRDHLSNEHK